ncbi:MAG: aspartate kinase [Halobacteriota archaeon]|nr:aspartate kinase [Halobacteriota archaeon]
MRLVMKFGGISVADSEKIRHVAELVKSYKDRKTEICVVTSAMYGVTDRLYEASKSAPNEDKTDGLLMFVRELSDLHHKAAIGSIDDEVILDEVLSEIDARLDEMEKALIGICHLGELTERSMDYIQSFGERLSVPILSGAIRSIGVDSEPMLGGKVGIITDDVYRNARPLDIAESTIQERLLPVLGDGIVPVVTGYIGETKKQIITTLGRGGSDYTATIIGAGIGADEIWLWKETEGIMSADPKIIPHARRIPAISYIEAMELSFFGANILHPSALEPAMRNLIPVRVKNTFKPNDPGTIITRDLEQDEDVVKAITLIKNVALINISGPGLVGSAKVSARVFSILADESVDIIIISQGSSERNISLVIDGPHLKKALRALKKGFDKTTIRDITYNKDVCALAVVGAGMAGVPGVAGRIFTVLGKNDISVIMISQGSSEHNISLVIEKKDSRSAIDVIHKEFSLGRGSSD